MPTAGLLSVILVAFVSVATGAATKEDGSSLCQGGSDTTSLLQGAKVQVDLLGRPDVAFSQKIAGSQPQAAAPMEEEVEDVSLFSAPATVKVGSKASAHSSPNALSRLSSLTSAVSFSHARSGISLLAGSLKAQGGVAAVLFIFLMAFCLALTVFFVVIYPQWGEPAKTKASSGALARQSAGDHASVEKPPHQSLWFAREGARPSPSQPQINSRLSSSAFSEREVGPRPSAWDGAGAPTSTLLIPRMVQPLVQLSAPTGYAAPLSQNAPPPLCPTLVMPVCEARFGIPMTELAQLGSTGQINIVGLSGNPLLRATIKMDQHQRRLLDICMPEKNSAPRATISASSPGLRGYEIRGMKGAFYGFLEMQSSGTCYVIKDGQTILLLDGDTDKLELGIKSGSGSQLASVRCSAEPFGGIEHVEIRVEPGVDTVLVLAVVLGVLLLSDR